MFAGLPAPRSGPTAALLRNWTASTIFFTRSALPTDVLVFYGAGYVRPDLVPGQPLYMYGASYPGGKRYNPAAFTVPPSGVLEGNLGRNVLRGFGAWQIDFAMHRKFELSERASLEFRAEIFNILNHPNFANPSNFGDPTLLVLRQTPNWGEATATLANGLSPSSTSGALNPLFQMGGPRDLQFGLRLRY